MPQNLPNAILTFVLFSLSSQREYFKAKIWDKSISLSLVIAWCDYIVFD